ncbi:hypothetical protein DVH24_015197, partial [Malus domestica]
ITIAYILSLICVKQIKQKNKILQNIVEKLTGHQQNGNHGKINGTVVLMKKNVLDFNDLNASVLDGVYELVGQGVSLQLISAVHADDSKNGWKGKLGQPAYLEDWITTITPLTTGESAFKVTFDYEEEVGVPGAFLIKNNHHSEFFLKTVTLENVPGEGRVHIVCNSWVYPTEKYTTDRVFFVNKIENIWYPKLKTKVHACYMFVQTYLPSETPLPLRKYREEELVHLRGNGKGELQEWDRVYDYAYYNDLGKPDEGAKYVRPVLGGSSEYPYPRRGRTGRPPTRTEV